MRTSDICPTCATFLNAKCVLYNGPLLETLNIPTLTDIETALVRINEYITNNSGITPQNGLQATTDIGNTTTNDISINNTVYKRREISVNNNEFNISFSSNSSFFRFDNTASNDNNVTFKKTNLTQSVVLQAPNKVGEHIIPLTVNNIAPNNAGNIVIPTSGGGSPGGSNTQLQFNNNGSFGGVVGLTWNEASKILNLATDGTLNDSAFVTVASQTMEFRDSDSSIRFPGSDVYAASFIKVGGNGSNVLLDDGTVTSLATLQPNLEGYEETGTQNGGNLVAVLGETTHPSLIANFAADSASEQVQMSTLNSYFRIRQNTGLFVGDTLTYRSRTSSNQVTFDLSNLTGVRNLQYPDADGTLARLEDIGDSLSLASTNVVNFNAVAGHIGGMNDVNSASNITLTIQPNATEDIPVGSVLTYYQVNTGRIIVNYSGAASGDTAETYKPKDVLSLWHKSLDNWVVINKPHRLDSQADNEPAGFTPIDNIGTISQVDYDAGTPVAGTTYLIV